MAPTDAPPAPPAQTSAAAGTAAAAVTLGVAPHPLLELGAWVADFAAAPGGLASPEWLRALLRPDAEGAPLRADEAVRGAVRDLLRHGGYKPTGRGKPASEYLVRAAGEGTLGSINAAVDAGNAVSLHSGLPVSVVDLARVRPPLSVALAPPGAGYVFNASGQSIDVEGLLCLLDAEGPCANAVKDSQRSKTGPDTTRVLCVVWGTRALPGRTDAALAFFRDVLGRLGAAPSPALLAP
jgi:DNA/RNA-binding domain of Phe-tRNA-synthetase-like protein